MPPLGKHYGSLISFSTESHHLPCGRELFSDTLGPAFRRRDIPQSQIRENWKSIFEEYPSRNLTHAADKWAAFSGMPELFQSLLNDRELCGLWRDNIHHDLLQRQSDGCHSDKEAFKALKNPSWSWTKLRKKVRLMLFSGNRVLRFSTCQLCGQVCRSPLESRAPWSRAEGDSFELQAVRKQKILNAYVKLSLSI